MKIIRFLFTVLFLAGCSPMNTPEFSLGAGFRFSSYGPPYNPGWVDFTVLDVFPPK